MLLAAVSELQPLLVPFRIWLQLLQAAAALRVALLLLWRRLVERERGKTILKNRWVVQHTRVHASSLASSPSTNVFMQAGAAGKTPLQGWSSAACLIKQVAAA